MAVESEFLSLRLLVTTEIVVDGADVEKVTASVLGTGSR